MVCIYCNGKTQVTNSRPQKRLGQTWRRRQCVNCGAVFSTTEGVDYPTSLVVRAQGRLQPFNRDKLFVSVFRALGHRKTAVQDAGALTATILAHVRVKAVNGAVEATDITSEAHSVLKRFDTAAAVQYAAYHQE